MYHTPIFLTTFALAAIALCPIPALSARVLPDYPSQKEIPYSVRIVKPGDTLFKLFKQHWDGVARFNRLDERHLVAGMKIKVPRDLKAAAGWTPLTVFLESAAEKKQYLLIDIEEQFLGAYAFGKLQFSAPISSANLKCLDENGKEKTCVTPAGSFRVLALHRDHVSSVYEDAETGQNIPMPYAAMFFIEPTEKGSVAYWIHGGDLPGYPASHGCIRLRPTDAKKLFVWLGGNIRKSEIAWHKNGAPIDIVNNPAIHARQGDTAVIPIPEISPARNVKAVLEGKGAAQNSAIFLKNGMHFALLAVDIASAPGLYELKIYDADTNELVMQKKVAVDKGLFKKHISKEWNTRSLTPKELERIRKEKEELVPAYHDGIDRPLWQDSGFRLPIKVTQTTGKVTHPFGEIRINPKNKRSRIHRGTDIKAPQGFPIRAIAAGRVSHVGYDYFLEGNITVIDHGLGVFSTYLHQSKILVAVGATVAQGQIIGEVGKTGNANGPHLHFSVKINGSIVDPMKLIENVK